MAGKDYSEQAYNISKRFEDLTTSSTDSWQDEQASRFGINYVKPIRQALSDIELPIERIIDTLDTKLNEIRNIANGK